jgi:hypothetical protein
LRITISEAFNQTCWQDENKRKVKPGPEGEHQLSCMCAIHLSKTWCNPSPSQSPYFQGTGN